MYEGLSVRGFLKEVRQGNIDTVDFYEKLFAKLRTLQKDYNFFVTIAEDQALTRAEDIHPGKLTGLPISVKDNICTQGIQSTAGSRILEGYVPPFDATAIAHIKKENGVVIGKTQQDEFGFGTFSTHSGYGVPRNPLDPTRTCGGSSGGAAGLTKALLFPHIALAESTGGSISCPASFCGVVGLTPTYGLVSRWGLIDYANSLDKIGVIARTVDDAALLLETIQGFDTNDFTSLNTTHKRYDKLEGIDGLTLGVPKEYMEGLDPAIAKLTWDAIHYLEKQGASYREVSLPHTKYALSAYYVIATAEASTNLARYCGMRYGATQPIKGDFNAYFSQVRSAFLGEEAKRRIMLGTFARMAGYRGKYYLRAFEARSLVIRDFEHLFRAKGIDTLVTPTMPLVAPKLDAIEDMQPVQHYQMDTLTVGPNLAGIPHLTVPWGTHHGLPVGVHLLGDHLHERTILRVGKALEQGNTVLDMD